MYAEVTVIVDGAVESVETFTDGTRMEHFLADVETDAKSDGYPTEVYILRHGHDMTDEECGCSQYVTDHHPEYSWNVEGIPEYPIDG